MTENRSKLSRAAVNSSDLRIAVVGAGIMGRGIIQIAARAGIPVTIFDGQPGKGEEAARYVTDMLQGMLTKGRLQQVEYDKAVGCMTIARSVEDLAGVDIVIEAIIEDLSIKRELFEKIEAVVAQDTILATNTSSLLVTEIAAQCRRPERVAGLHFFNPVPLMRLVEVIPGVHTEGQVVDELVALVKRVGHSPVLASDSPGFLVNHAGRGLYTEGIRIVSEGVASVYDVDRVAKEVAGFRMGPFELFDLTGLDVSFPVLTKIYQQFYEEPRFRPHPMLRSRVAAGLFGKKVGRGFYEYSDGKQVAVAEAAAPVVAARPVWVAPDSSSGNDGSRQALTEWLRQTGIGVDSAAAPGSDSIVLLAPLGIDATTAAARAGLPLERCVAIDTLIWPAARITLMPTVATRPEYRDALHAMLAAHGKVTVINDSTGFIAQRMVASIINIACDIAQHRIATPADIDLAVTLGLGYPAGPLALGDRIGAVRILTVLDGIHACTRDPRYRPSPWLMRRALAGLSLAALYP